MVAIRDFFLLSVGLYLYCFLYKVYKRNRQLTKATSKFMYGSLLAFIHFNTIMIVDVLLDYWIGEGSDQNPSLKSYEYKVLVPVTHFVVFEVIYAFVIFLFFLTSYCVLNEIVYQSMDGYLHSYNSGVEQIVRMTANLVTQGLLLLVVYFILVLLTCWFLHDQTKSIWKDNGFVLLVSNVLGGIMRYPQRRGSDWKDFYYNSAALFISLKFFLFCLT